MAPPPLRAVRWAVLALVLATLPAHAAETEWVGDANAAVRLVTATDAAGEAPTLSAALEFRYAPGWHGSWRSPGDAGFAPRIDWSGSEGIGLATLAWPAPRRLVVGDLQTFVYETATLLPLALERRGDGPVRLQASVRHAICGEICVPYRADLALTLPAGRAVPSAQAPAITAATARVPGAPDKAGFTVSAATVTGAPQRSVLRLDLRSDSTPFAAPDLFVEGLDHGVVPAPALVLSEGGSRARLDVELPPQNRPPGRLTLTVTDGARAAEIRLDPTPAGSASFLAILATALLGGLILNLMPCVLPVLSLKAFALARHAGGGHRTIRVGMLATAAGIVASFLGIGLALVALKASGASVGWGIQFQEPWFLAGLAVVTVLFAASLFDWITIGLPGGLAAIGSTRGWGPISEAFLTGAFATLLATPCSAPFVGTAVAFALAAGPAETLSIFMALGLGMALPYLAGALAPGTLRRLPRPGPWMVWLRCGLGLLLLGTAMWLVVVLRQSAGATGAGLVALLLCALLAWLALRRHGAGFARIAVAALIAVAAVGAALLPAATPGRTPETGPWQAFDPAALPGLVAGGRTIVVDVTASWCLTCTINDATTFSRDAVKARLDRTDTIRMRADWTRPDPAILAYLRSFGRSGIPLVVVYGPGRPGGEALPELLTPGTVLAALTRAQSSSVDRHAGAGTSP